MAQKQQVDYGANAGVSFKKLIKKSGLTQAQFGEKFGCQVRTIRNWYNRIDNLQTITQIANFFDVNLVDVINGDIE